VSDWGPAKERLYRASAVERTASEVLYHASASEMKGKAREGGGRERRGPEHFRDVIVLLKNGRIKRSVPSFKVTGA
jgi:hypothetical protein